MGFIQQFKQTIKRSDLLGAPAILRAKGEPFYQSLFGGAITIILLILFTLIFIFKFMAMLNLQYIQASGKYVNVQNDTKSIDDFFFGVDIPFITYQEMTTLFKIQLKVVQTGKQDKIIKLVNCTQQMWNSRQIYDKLLYTGKYLCPQKTEDLKIYHTTQNESFLKLSVNCLNCSDPVFLDLQQRVLTQHDLFQANIKMINSIRSDNDKNPITKYIDSIPFATFSSKLGARAMVQLMTYQITTDVSFLPYSDEQTLTGFVIPNTMTTKTQINSNSDLLICNFQKYKLEWQVQRQYGKFDDLLSYVGGLFGLLFFVISFFLATYNEIKYQIMIAETVFKNQGFQNNKAITEANWNFLTYLKFVIYDWLSFFNCAAKQWKSMKCFNQSIQQSLCLLDIKYLIKRIRYLEHAVSVMLQKNKQICLRVIDLPSLQTVRKQRKIMDIFDQYKIKKQKLKSKLKLADIQSQENLIIKNAVQETFFQGISQKKIQKNKKSLERSQTGSQLSDSQNIQADNIKHQIQFAIKEMLRKKSEDDQYNKIYQLMDSDFKELAQSNFFLSFESKMKNLQQFQNLDSGKSFKGMNSNSNFDDFKDLKLQREDNYFENQQKRAYNNKKTNEKRQDSSQYKQKNIYPQNKKQFNKQTKTKRHKKNEQRNGD